MKTNTPNYTTRKTADGKRLVLTLAEKDADGRVRSITCEYPFYLMLRNEKGELESTRLSKKQTEKYLLECLGC